MKKIGKPEETTNRRKGGGADGLGSRRGNLSERKPLARRGLNAKFLKDLEDTGDLGGM